MKSLDPRVNRLPVVGEPGQILPKIPLDQFGTFEVFVQPKEGKPFQHEGIVHAPNLEMAFVLGKETFTRRFLCYSFYVTDTRNVYVSAMTDGTLNAYEFINDVPEPSGEKVSFEIYHLLKRGKQHQHIGNVKASTPQEAMAEAKKVFNSDKAVFNIWSIRTSDIRFTDADEKDLWFTLPEKFRDASDYKGGDKLKEFFRTHEIMNEAALKELIYKLADDLLIIGHRNSEWTGFGPLLEEDIAFSSMAQDKIGQSHALYAILHTLGERDPDTVAFTRNADQFHNCILVELPNGEYDFSLIRHFLYDTAEVIRFEMLSQSSYQPLADLSKKIRAELRYHTLHANTWMKQLGTATEESISRLQKSLDYALPFALGMFEESPYEKEIIASGIYGGEQVLKEKWTKKIEEVIGQTNLTLPDWKIIQPVFGGRAGKHTEHLQPLLDEMSEVFRIDPSAEW